MGHLPAERARADRDALDARLGAGASGRRSPSGKTAFHSVGVTQKLPTVLVVAL